MEIGESGEFSVEHGGYVCGPHWGTLGNNLERYLNRLKVNGLGAWRMVSGTGAQH